MSQSRSYGCLSTGICAAGILVARLSMNMFYALCFSIIVGGLIFVGVVMGLDDTSRYSSFHSGGIPGE